MPLCLVIPSSSRLLSIPTLLETGSLSGRSNWSFLPTKIFPEAAKPALTVNIEGKSLVFIFPSYCAKLDRVKYTCLVTGNRKVVWYFFTGIVWMSWPILTSHSSFWALFHLTQVGIAYLQTFDWVCRASVPQYSLSVSSSNYSCPQSLLFLVEGFWGNYSAFSVALLLRIQFV